MIRVFKAKTDDQPSERELGWYHQWAVLHRRLSAIAAEADAEQLEVCRAVEKVDAWMRTRLMNDVQSLRRRHSETLEQLTADCLRKWNGSDQVNFAEQARKTLADLRRLWNVDSQDESDSHEKDEAMVWLPGMTQAEAMRNQITLMQEALKGMRDDTQATA